jgi:hypothetical protein
MNVKNKKVAIRKVRNDFKAVHDLHTKSFGFKVEGPDTYIWNNVNARMNNVIATEDSVPNAKCFKVEAKSYELFRGDWFVTHTNGDVYYLNSVEMTQGYYDKWGYGAWYTKGESLKHKAAKKGDYKVPHLCYGWRVLSDEYLAQLRKEVEEDKKDEFYHDETPFSVLELETVEAYIKKEGLAFK